MRHVSTILSGLAFLWATAATVYLLAVAGQADTASALSGRSAAVGRMGVSLASANGVWVSALLFVVTVIAGLPFGVALTDPERHRVVTRIAGTVLLAFSMVSGFAVGLMYLPCAIVLLAAGAGLGVRSKEGAGS